MKYERHDDKSTSSDALLITGILLIILGAVIYLSYLAVTMATVAREVQSLDEAIESASSQSIDIPGYCRVSPAQE